MTEMIRAGYRLRFRLRTVIAIMTLAAISCACVRLCFRAVWDRKAMI